MNGFYDAHGTRLSVYTSEPEVVLNLRPTGSDVPGAEHRMTTEYARTIGQLLIDHADAIDKKAKEQSRAEALKRRDAIAQSQIQTDWVRCTRAEQILIQHIVDIEDKADGK